MVKVETGCASSADTTRRKFTTLITFDGNRKPQYVGRCKIKIDLSGNVLKVYPKNERFNDITATFDWKFIRLKNILFVFAKLDSQDFVLVFKNEEVCTKVFNGIFKNRDADSIEEELLNGRFLNLLFKNAFKNRRMKEIMEEWIQKFDEKDKNEYLKLLKWHQENPIEISDEEENDIKDIKPKIESLPKTNRKRRHHEIEHFGLSNSVNVVDLDNFVGLDCCDDAEFVEGPSENLNSSYQFSKIIYGSKFEIVNFKNSNRFRRKLLIFTSSDRIECYEFKFCRSKQLFYHRCCEKSRSMKAILDLDENGQECIKMEDKYHRCYPIFYESDKYFELKTVRKPDYEILENCASQSKSKRMLIIFDLNDRSQCYEYYWSLREKTFFCRGCITNGKKPISAEIFHENTGDEYIMISNEEHVCKMRKYNSKKYFSSNEIVTSPNFEIQAKIKNGIERRKTLIIFVEKDRKLCYAYTYCNNRNLHWCKGCKRMKQYVTAKIRKNDENEEYVILSNKKHACSPQNYIQQNQIILRPPKFKFIKANEKQKSKLFIFDKTDPKLCYVFSQHSNEKRYRCLGCLTVAKQKKNINENEKVQTKQVVSVFLNKDDDANYFVEINDGEKHICQAQKYQPEKYEMKILKPKIDYIMFREKKQNGNINLVIYHPNDKELCYKYSYVKLWKYFRCLGCFKKNTHVSAKIHQDSNENEYLIVNQKEHVCSPIKYSLVVEPDTVILEKSGLELNGPKKAEIDGNNIIRYPKFELQRNSKGVPEKRLIIFFKDDRQLCYDYKYEGYHFVCKKCKASAKIQIDDENDNDKFVVLSETKHKCQPVEYEPEYIIIESKETENENSNFMVFNRDDETKLTKLVIFTSSTKELCYKYSYFKRDKTFQCCGCHTLKKIVSAKLLKNPDDEKEYVHLLKNGHVCAPKKFVLEEFQPKIIPENGFKLCSNKNGKPNSKLILFDSEKDGFAYEYSLKKNNYFVCYQCKCKNSTVSAKLFEKENGEKYLELSSTKHVCESKKYEEEKTKVITNNFVTHFNSSGVRESRLTILNDADESLGYRYSLKSRNLFICDGCDSKKKHLSAKLITDKDGNQFLEFNKNGHACVIQNLKEEKVYFDDFKFEENGNILITNDPTQNNRCYKFAYDEKLGTFCCTKCLETKKKYVTATICQENDEKEFVLLNVPHCCVSLLK